MAKIEQKAPIIEEIKSNLDGFQGVVLADYRGINVSDDTKMRKELREAGVVYKVYKNTYIKLAIKGTELEALNDMLEGPTALAVSKTDSTAPARIIAKYAKTVEPLSLKCGYIDGAYYDKAAIEQIASLPGREELIGRLLGSIKSPISNFARVLNQIAEKTA